MRALTKFAPEAGAVDLREVPEPELAPDAVLIEVAYAAVCGTDRHAIEREGDPWTPRILGHEASGRVVRLGEAVIRPDLEPGTPVTFETDAFLCMRCPACRREEYNRCPNRRGIGTTADGALADRIAMPERAVHPLPEGVSLRAGALTEPLSIAVHAVLERDLGSLAGEVVIVTGPGAVGQLTALTARAVGAIPVLVGRTRHRDRLDRARECGVPYVVDSETESVADRVAQLTQGRGARAVFECTGSADVAQESLGWLDRGGQVVLVAFYSRSLALDADVIVNRELSVLGSRGKKPSSYRTALALMAQGLVRPEDVVGAELALTEWREGIELVAQGTKVIFRIAP